MPVTASQKPRQTSQHLYHHPLGLLHAREQSRTVDLSLEYHWIIRDTGLTDLMRYLSLEAPMDRATQHHPLEEPALRHHGHGARHHQYPPSRRAERSSASGRRRCGPIVLRRLKFRLLNYLGRLRPLGLIAFLFRCIVRCWGWESIRYYLSFVLTCRTREWQALLTASNLCMIQTSTSAILIDIINCSKFCALGTLPS